MTLLNYAARNMKNTAIVQMLLEHGADPNITRKWDGKSSFHCYCAEHFFEYPELLNTFFEHGADANQKDIHSSSIVSDIFYGAVKHDIRIDDYGQKFIKTIMQQIDYDSINHKNDQKETIISCNLFLNIKESEYINHILEKLLEFGLNPCDKETLTYINKSYSSKIKQEYLKFIPKWKEECKNYVGFLAYQRAHGDLIKKDSSIFKKIKEYTYEWDVSRMWKVWWVLSKDAAIKKEQEEITSLMNIEY